MPLLDAMLVKVELPLLDAMLVKVELMNHFSF